MATVQVRSEKPGTNEHAMFFRRLADHQSTSGCFPEDDCTGKPSLPEQAGIRDLWWQSGLQSRTSVAEESSMLDPTSRKTPMIPDRPQSHGNDRPPQMPTDNRAAIIQMPPRQHLSQWSSGQAMTLASWREEVHGPQRLQRKRPRFSKRLHARKRTWASLAADLSVLLQMYAEIRRTDHRC